ncbi:unnamed protein product [Closterium sp. NIES-54]
MKSTRQRPAGLLQPLKPPKRPWQQVTMDFVTGMPAGPSSNDAVLVVLDRLTKMAHFAPGRTARLFISTVVRVHGIPSAIISDRDLKFTSNFWKETWAHYGMKLQFSSAYHPQTDGQTEQTNQTIEQLIRTNCPDPARWEDSLAMLDSGGSGDGGVGSSGSGGGRRSSRCGAVRWGVSGGGQLLLQRRVVAVAVVAVAVQLFSWEFLAVAWCSCSGVRTRPLRPNNFVSGTLSVGRLGVVLAARTSFAQGVDIFALDYDAILTAMYALTIGAKGDCYLCVLPGPGIEAASLGANESALPGTAPTEALHTFTLDSGLSLYTLATEPPEVAASAQVSASGQVAPPCSCHLLSHQTLLWHHRLGHPSLPRFRGMHSRLLLSGLPRSLPPLSPSPAPPCLPCVEGRQRAASHSSSFSLTTAPLQTLHMDVWGPALSGQGCERYFLLVVDNYTRYTMVFPLRSKDQFHQDIPVLRLHFYRGGEFSSDLLRELCRGEGILQSFTLPTSPQKNGISQRRIGLVMEVAHTSMIHAAAPHFLWPLAVPYAAHQLNLWPRVSLPKTSPTLHWTGKVGNASVFWVWDSRAFVRDTSADKLSARAIPCDVTFDKSVPFYPLFPYRSAPPRTPPLFLAPGPPPVDFLPPHGPSPSGVSQVDHLLGTVPVKVAGASGAARGAASGGAASRGAEPRGAELGGAEPGAAGARDSAAGDIGAGGVGATSLGGAGVTAGASGTGDAAAAGPRAGGAGAGDPVEPGGAGAGGAGAGATRAVDPRVGGARDGGIGAGGARAGGAGVGATGAIDPGAGGAVSGGTGAGGTVQPRPYFVPLLQQVLGLPSSAGLTPPLLCPPLDQSQPPLQPASPLPAPSTYSEQIGGLIERCKPESRPASPVRAVRTGRRVPRPRPPPVPGTHAMALRPSSVPLRVPLPPPPESSLRADPSPESDLGELRNYLGLQITQDRARRTITLTQSHMVH